MNWIDNKNQLSFKQQILTNENIIVICLGLHYIFQTLYHFHLINSNSQSIENPTLDALVDI
jgi:hypothetical protein